MHQHDFHFTLTQQDDEARCGYFTCSHGHVRTPAFMPVGTLGSVKALYMEQVKATGADIILGNTYHLMLRPSAELIHKLGGLHEFINWQYPILTDSGGFQVMSLAKLRKVENDGVHFQSHIDGERYFLTPKRAMEIQALLNSDVQMQLDECIALPASHIEIKRAMELSLQWAEQSKLAFESHKQNKHNALFGIVQGGDNITLRKQSARELVAMDMHGFSIGGLAVGEPQKTMLKMLEATCPELPQNKPRYLMGVGTPDDILQSIERGIDMFDCVIPTREGRHGIAYTKFGKLNLKNAKHKQDKMPLDETSACPASCDYSRAYLHHLIKSNEPLGAMLLSWNNLFYYQTLMQGAREAIENKTFADYKMQTKENWQRGEENV